MTSEHLNAILKESRASTDKQGWYTLPAGTTLNIHVAHSGTGFAVNSVEAIRANSDLVYARTSKKQLFCFACDDIFAILIDGITGEPARRAGFG